MEQLAALRIDTATSPGSEQVNNLC